MSGRSAASWLRLCLPLVKPKTARAGALLSMVPTFAGRRPLLGRFALERFDARMTVMLEGCVDALHDHVVNLAPLAVRYRTNRSICRAGCMTTERDRCYKNWRTKCSFQLTISWHRLPVATFSAYRAPACSWRASRETFRHWVVLYRRILTVNRDFPFPGGALLRQTAMDVLDWLEGQSLESDMYSGKCPGCTSAQPRQLRCIANGSPGSGGPHGSNPQRVEFVPVSETGQTKAHGEDV